MNKILNRRDALRLGGALATGGVVSACAPDGVAAGQANEEPAPDLAPLEFDLSLIHI